MDEAEVKVFSAITRLRNILGEFIIEMNANREEVMCIIEENLDDIIAKVGDPESVAKLDELISKILEREETIFRVNAIDGLENEYAIEPLGKDVWIELLDKHIKIIEVSKPIEKGDQDSVGECPKCSSEVKPSDAVIDAYICQNVDCGIYIKKDEVVNLKGSGKDGSKQG